MDVLVLMHDGLVIVCLSGNVLISGDRCGVEFRVYPCPGVFREDGDPIHDETVANVLKFVLLAAVILFAVAIVQIIVLALKDRRPWPRKQHLGHWRKWDEEDEE